LNNRLTFDSELTDSNFCQKYPQWCLLWTSMQFLFRYFFSHFKKSIISVKLPQFGTL
jgi:hypothetical protein